MFDKKQITRTRKISWLALALAMAFSLHSIDTLICAASPYPAFRLGLANLVIVVLFLFEKPKWAFFVGIGKCALSSLLFGSVVSLTYSLAGTILAFLIMLLLQKGLHCKISWILSISAALLHGIGQVLVAAIITKSCETLLLVFPMTVIGIITGLVIGLVSGMFFQHFSKISKKMRKKS